MRVIAGEARGFPLRAPPGMATRPMADKIRGALFSMLASLGVAPDRVLDLYGGSGAVGIEALSRGASWVDFVERNGVACEVIRANLARTKFAERAAVHQVSVESFLTRSTAQQYDFVIVDPPYADPGIASNLARLARSTLSAPGTVIALGHSPRVELGDLEPPLVLVRRRCHGDSCFSLFEIAGGAEPLVGNANQAPVEPALE